MEVVFRIVAKVLIKGRGVPDGIGFSISSSQLQVKIDRITKTAST